MKLCRYGEPGQERPALIDQIGGLRSLAGVIGDLSPDVLAPAPLAVLAAIDPLTSPPVDAGVRLGVPIAGFGKYVCIGLNLSGPCGRGGSTSA